MVAGRGGDTLAGEAVGVERFATDRLDTVDGGGGGAGRRTGEDPEEVRRKDAGCDVGSRVEDIVGATGGGGSAAEIGCKKNSEIRQIEITLEG